jgi:imidazolonepropionase-like amidohydrolase
VVKKSIHLLLFLILGTCAHAQVSAQSSRAVAILNVNVIPMDREGILQNQTVVVRNGLITEVGDTKKVKVPRDAQRIDGTDEHP